MINEDLLLRGVLASELKCWHRLTNDESQNLIDFVKNMGAKQEQGEPFGSVKNGKLTVSIAGGPVEWKKRKQYSGPVYTTPPQQRAWVGLTEEEMNVINRHNIYVSDIINATEAKLCEKNGIAPQGSSNNG
ncbi:MAG: hypothetical protein RLZZ481_2108 [Pseudomonadota bacterium]|jgi:hypothetical protein